jgi:hypothetical protein
MQPTKIGDKPLTDRARELLQLFRVNPQNRAIYTRDDVVPDWATVKKVFLGLGAAWKKGTKAAPAGFQFPEDVDGEAMLSVAISSGVVFDHRAAGFFPTPAHLAAQMAEYVDPQPGQKILEPSAGTGALALAIRARCPTVWIDCIEPVEANVVELKVFGFLVRASTLEEMAPEDHLGRGYDGIIANPPFGKRLEVKHFLKLVPMLKGGGKLACVMPASLSFREDDLTVRARRLIEHHGGRIEQNPEGTFKQAGTMVNTVTVYLTKKVQ